MMRSAGAAGACWSRDGTRPIGLPSRRPGPRPLPHIGWLGKFDQWITEMLRCGDRCSSVGGSAAGAAGVGEAVSGNEHGGLVRGHDSEREGWHGDDPFDRAPALVAEAVVGQVVDGEYD